MADLQGGETFLDGQSFNAARANNHVNGADAQPGLISDKGEVPEGSIAVGDYVLLLQTSTNALKKAKVVAINKTGGNVTSVGLAMPTGFTVAGSPVTGAGVITVSFTNQSGDKFLASPVDGSSGAPTFRNLGARDLQIPYVVPPAFAFDWNNGVRFYKALDNNRVLSMTNVPQSGEILVAVTYNGFTITDWTSTPAIRWPNGVIPVPSGSATTVFRFAAIAGFLFGWAEASALHT